MHCGRDPDGAHEKRDKGRRMSAIGAAANVATHTGLSKGAKIGIGIGIGALAVGVLAGCAVAAKPEDYVAKIFNPFDDNEDNAVSQDEAQRDWQSVRSQDVFQYTLGDTDVYDRQTFQTTWTESVLRAVNAADRNGDAVASYGELKNLALTFDENKDGILKSGEQSKFAAQYGAATLNKHTELIGHETVYATHHYDTGGGYDPGPVSPGDDYGTGGGYDPGPVSPGDDYGNSGGSTPPAGGDDYGDSGGYTPPSTGGSSGDDYGDSGGYTPPSSGGSSGDDYGSDYGNSGGSSGDSSDNGNPSDDDF
ncbi:MAG: hypothetical protein JWN72_1560 [Thermoleophilia bacterium]|nr:hypothetical protein [Thermoleophilia bacterium]